MKARAGSYVCCGVIAWIPWAHGADVCSPVSSGTVQWAVQSLEVSRNSSSFSSWLLRSYGSYGPLVVDVAVDDKNGGKGASRNLGFTVGQYTWVSGDNSEREVRIPVLNASYLDSANQVRLLITSTEPPCAQHPTKDVLQIMLANLSSEGYVEFNTNLVTTSEGLSAHFEECLLYATRARGLGERIIVNFTLVECDFPLNPAREWIDFEVYSNGFAAIWEPTESDTRCIVREQRINTGNVLGLFLWRDALIEGLETICLLANISPELSTMSDSMLIIAALDDVNAPIFECAKGKECILNCSTIIADPTDEIVIRRDGCSPCNKTLSSDKKHGRDCPISYGLLYDDANESEPFFVCECLGDMPSASGRWLGQFLIRGPLSDNIATCIMGSPVCKIELQENGPDQSNEFVQIAHDMACSDFASIPQGFYIGGHGKISSQSTAEVGVYFLNDPLAMAPEEAGIYQICWCQQSEKRDCSNRSEDSYFVKAGLFFYNGPYYFGHQDHTLGEFLALEGVTGIELSKNDRIALQKECGRDDHPWSLVSQVSQTNSGLYEFGVLDMYRVDPVRYNLCWCQPNIYRNQDGTLGEIKCDKPSDFASSIGRILFMCRDQYADEGGRGHCKLCTVWTTPDPHHLYCKTDLTKVLLLIYSICAAISCVLSCCMENGIIFFNGDIRRLRFHGRRILIEDISTQAIGVIITTKGAHRLFSYFGSVPILLEGTGYYKVDWKPGAEKRFRVKVESPNRLKLLDDNAGPLAFAVESSSGSIALPFGRGMFYTLLFKSIPVPAYMLFSLGTALAIQINYLAYHDVTLMFILFVVDFVLGVIFALFWWHGIDGNTTSLGTSLSVYRKRLAEWTPSPERCDRGPLRGVTAFKLLNLHEFFASFIKLRTMYYLDHNIVRPLTKKFQLSYAEVAGPIRMEWFVSHFWGTPFRHFCDTIRLHATTTTEGNDVDMWKSSTYWICIFSNNQYEIAAELGSGDFAQSSFYKALHSGLCQGTCMVLDEQALPLTRSWCLFELLQTMSLEQTQDRFKGLLFCTRTGVLNYGRASVTLSMNIGRRLATLKLEDADATIHEDKEMISRLVLQQEGCFKRINKSLRNRIESALIVCKRRVEEEFSQIVENLQELDPDILTLDAL